MKRPFLSELAAAAGLTLVVSAAACLDNDFVAVKTFCLMLGGMMTAEAVYFAAVENGFARPAAPPGAAAAALFLLVALSAASSIRPCLSAPALQIWGVCLALWIAGVLLGPSERLCAKVLNAVALAACLFAAHGIVQRLGYDPLPVNNYLFDKGGHFKTSSVFGNPAILADYLAAALPLVAWRAMPAKNGPSALWTALTFVVLAAIALTRSRTAALAALAGLGVLGACAGPAFIRGVVRSRPFLAAVAAGGVLLSAALVFPRLSMGPGERFQYDKAKTVSVQQRLFSWGVARSMAAERPLLGWGPETFRYLALGYQARANRGELTLAAKRDDAFEKPGVAHNDYLQTAAESGWPAGVALALFFVLSATFGARRGRSRPDLAAAAAVIAAGSVCAVFSFPLRIAPTAGLIFFAAGLAASGRDFPLTAVRKPDRLSLASILLWIPLMAALFYGLGIYLSAHKLIAAKNDIQQGHHDAARANLRAAVSNNSCNGEALYLIGARELQAGHPAEAVDYFKRAGRYVEDPVLRLNHGHALLELGDPSGALDQFQRASDMYPNNIPALKRLAQAQCLTNRLADCLATLDRVLAIQPDDADAREFRRRAAERGVATPP